MSATLFELAVHFGMELYPGDEEARKKYVDWYIETNGGTNFPIQNIPIIPDVTNGLRIDA